MIEKSNLNERNKILEGCSRRFTHKKEGQESFSFVCGNYCLCSKCVTKLNNLQEKTSK